MKKAEEDNLDLNRSEDDMNIQTENIKEQQQFLQEDHHLKSKNDSKNGRVNQSSIHDIHEHENENQKGEIQGGDPNPAPNGGNI